MSATVYQWGEAIGLQWYDRGPIVFLGPDGLTTHRHSLPADAVVLLHAGDEGIVDQLDEEWEAGYQKGLARGHQDALDEMIQHLNHLRGA